MKKIITVGGFAAAFFVFGTAVRAATSAQIEVSATITAVTSLNATLKTNVASPVTAASMAFGAHNSSEGAWAATGIAPYFIDLSVQKNDSNWRLRLTTKNMADIQSLTPTEVAFTTTTWGYSYGGMVSTTTAGGKIPFAWRVSTTTANGSAPAVGDPSVAGSGWTFVKDQEDYDDPGVTGNQSFDWVDGNTGYCNIAFGGPSYTTAICLPNPLVPLPTPTSSFKLFVNGNFSGAKAAGYGPAPANAAYETAATQNKLVLDLLNTL